MLDSNSTGQGSHLEKTETSTVSGRRLIGAGSWKGSGRDALVLPLLESCSTLNVVHVQREGQDRRNSSTLRSHCSNLILK